MNRGLLAALPLALALAVPARADVTQATVTAKAETAPIEGDADDPAIWVNPADPAASLIFGTDKTAGLHVFALDGTRVAFFEDGEVNNVDIRPFTLAGEQVWLVSTAERGQEELIFYIIRADGSVERATPFAFPPVPADMAAAVKDIYGSALMRNPATGQVYAAVNFKSGDIVQWEVVDAGGALSLDFVRHLKVDTQPEGMVSDDRMGHLYVGEEDVAIWRFPAWPGEGDEPVAIDTIPSDCFPRDDIEGLSIYDGAEARYLVASSQGIHRAAIYALEGDAATCVGLVEVGAGLVDGVSETDGLDVTALPVGPDYPEGMLVMMDDQNEMFTTAFKMISFAEVKAALGLR